MALFVDIGASYFPLQLAEFGFLYKNLKKQKSFSKSFLF
ncbi:hypothetical protein QO000_001731 [Alkalihalobacillus hemicentroti]|uniref:Uncharacterized protein n=1 Tax=Guptibacillus hwajinpoensis TaxID=208199 RepID=A0ABU0K0E5_9BACL|nr:hypothetical protein [Alkalihalobacillus hemicentroti]